VGVDVDVDVDGDGDVDRPREAWDQLPVIGHVAVAVNVNVNVAVFRSPSDFCAFPLRMI
jgi:hypothetical protein